LDVENDLMRDAVLSRLFRRFSERGDGRALAAVFDATSKPLLELACHLVRDPAEAEDLVQAAFLTAIRKSASYDESAPVQAWLYGILWREAAKARRRAARAVDPRRVHARAEPDPLELVAAHEVPAAVGAALARLPARYREVLEPLLYEEKRADRIARDLARSPGTVRSQIHRGLEELRRALGPRFALHGLAALPTRGLARVRAEVLHAAGFPAATAALAPAAALALTAGGVAMSKSVVVGTAALALVAGGTWIALERSSEARSEASVEVGSSSAALAVVPPDGAAPAADVQRVATEPAAGAPPAAPARAFEETVAFWLARFGEAPDDWRHGWNVAAEIAELPADEALAVMQAVWEHLSVPVKEQALKPFVFHGGHPHALEVLHLAATDEALSVQERALGYLKSYAFRDFALDYGAYLAWAEENRTRPVGEVLADSARGFVGDLLALGPAQLAGRLRELERLDVRAGAPAGVDVAAVMRDAGGMRVIETALADPDPEVRSIALDWSKTLGADEPWLRTWVLPELTRPPEETAETIGASLSALARPECAWARDDVLAYLERCTRERLPGLTSAGRTLAEMGDLAAIPRMIELMLADTTGELNYWVGYYGLAKLTGVTWQESYDAAWWAGWWEKNRARFPPEVAALSVRR
jgi:RNA polymerase sigma-70 factor (ECF subfamily)